MEAFEEPLDLPDHGVAAPLGDLSLVEALRRGEEAAFVALVDCQHAALIRLALLYVPNPALAEDVVQETWLGVLRGIDRFEGRSSLRTWIVRILINRAKRHSGREQRTVTFSTLGAVDGDRAEPAVDPARFLPPGHPWAGHWAAAPHRWDVDPERWMLSQEMQVCVEHAIAALPPSQRAVIILRDVEGWTAAEVCYALDVSETNQRQRLHRARSTVRRAIERYREGA